MGTSKHSVGVTFAIAAGFLALAGGAKAQSAIEGTWLTPTQSEMTIRSCVEGHCGFISKVVITDQIRAKYGSNVDAMTSYTDYNNKNPALRDRPIEGLQILTLREATRGPHHFEGEIYNPEDGNTYTGFIEVMGPDSLKLKGCAMMVLCQEQLWQRVE